jgi:hypothetical protein
VGEAYVKQAGEASSLRLNKLARLLEQRKLPDKVTKLSQFYLIHTL